MTESQMRLVALEHASKSTYSGEPIEAIEARVARLLEFLRQGKSIDIAEKPTLRGRVVMARGGPLQVGDAA